MKRNKKLAKAVIEELSCRKGFDGWWWNTDDDIQDEIIESIAEVLDTPIGETCEHCRFYYADSLASECRRNPPVHTDNDDAILSAGSWPHVTSEGWCGEFKKKF